MYTDSEMDDIVDAMGHEHQAAHLIQFLRSRLGGKESQVDKLLALVATAQDQVARLITILEALVQNGGRIPKCL